MVADDGEDERPAASGMKGVTGVAGSDCLPARLSRGILHPTLQRIIMLVVLVFSSAATAALDFAEGTRPATRERDSPGGLATVRCGDRGRAGGLVAINHR